MPIPLLFGTQAPGALREAPPPLYSPPFFPATDISNKKKNYKHNTMEISQQML